MSEFPGASRRVIQRGSDGCGLGSSGHSSLIFCPFPGATSMNEGACSHLSDWEGRGGGESSESRGKRKRGVK